MWHHDGIGGAGFILSAIVMVVFWVVVIGGIVLLVRYLVRHLGPNASGAANPARRAEEMLAERFASGEIDEEQYRQRLEVLRTNRK